MAVFSHVAFWFGAVAYMCALLRTGSIEGEIASDVGNGAMLTAAVVMLFQIHKLLIESGQEKTAQQSDASDATS